MLDINKLNTDEFDDFIKNCDPDIFNKLFESFIREVGEPTKNKKFTDYYSDPEFRKKHLEYVSTRVVCECGMNTRRNNLSKHRKSHIHIRKLSNREDEIKKKIKDALDRQRKKLMKQFNRK